jgi:transcriptional regulator with XRE-family HTH domain
MPTTSATRFGDLLRHYRQVAGLTQQELAERSGLCVHGFQKLERGATHPYRHTAQRLMLALRLEAEDRSRFQAAIAPVRRHGSAPQPGSPGDPRHNLPSLVTGLVGRNGATHDVMRLLDGTRLLTLTGVGAAARPALRSRSRDL